MLPVIHLVRTSSTTLGSGNNNQVGAGPPQEAPSHWVNIEIPNQSVNPTISIQRNNRGLYTLVFQQTIQKTNKAGAVSIQLSSGNHIVDIT